MKFEIKGGESNEHLGPVDYFNYFGAWSTIFEGSKTCYAISDSTASSGSDINEVAFELVNREVLVVGENTFDLTKGSLLTPFMALTIIRFKGIYETAHGFVTYEIMRKQIPYVRVGVDWFKITKKPTRYGGNVEKLTKWSERFIKLDFSHDSSILKRIPQFDGFVIVPDNINYSKSVGTMYNEYAPFQHKPHTEAVTLDDIPHTHNLIAHIFGEQTEMGFQYLKVIYEHPKRALPVLALVSTERETGKTTFINWIGMIFGDNSVLISPDDFTNDFNASYATKNVVMMDEAVMHKKEAMEKIKSVATTKRLNVNTKHVSQYEVEFFGKIILCTNNETDFGKIDEEEIRFWVRKVSPIEGKKNTAIEDHLFLEIPKLLKYLLQLPPIDFQRSRMVFTQEEIGTEALKKVKGESKSWLRKEIELEVQNYFDTHEDRKVLMASAQDIKREWFSNNNQVLKSYIIKTLKTEMKMLVSESLRYPTPFQENEHISTKGRYYTFENPNYTQSGKQSTLDLPEESVISSGTEEDPF